jgi:hypothetical protein
MKKIKDNKTLKVVKSEWEEILEPEYHLNVKCPKCNVHLDYYQLYTLKGDNCNISEGRSINRKVVCPYCEKEFRLIVKEIE